MTPSRVVGAAALLLESHRLPRVPRAVGFGWDIFRFILSGGSDAVLRGLSCTLSRMQIGLVCASEEAVSQISLSAVPYAAKPTEAAKPPGRHGRR